MKLVGPRPPEYEECRELFPRRCLLSISANKGKRKEQSLPVGRVQHRLREPPHVDPLPRIMRFSGPQLTPRAIPFMHYVIFLSLPLLLKRLLEYLLTA